MGILSTQLDMVVGISEEHKRLKITIINLGGVRYRQFKTLKLKECPKGNEKKRSYSSPILRSWEEEEVSPVETGRNAHGDRRKPEDQCSGSQVKKVLPGEGHHELCQILLAGKAGKGLTDKRPFDVVQWRSLVALTSSLISLLCNVRVKPDK